MGEGDHREPAWGGDQEPVHGDARGAGGFLHPVSCSSGSQDWSHETDGGLGQQNPSVTQAGGDGCDGEERDHLALGALWLWYALSSPNTSFLLGLSKRKTPRQVRFMQISKHPVLGKHCGSWLVGPALTTHRALPGGPRVLRLQRVS